MLDLELPADAYIDSEEGEQLEDEKVSEVHEVSCLPLKSISETPYWNDSRLFPCNEGLPATYEGGFRTTNSLLSKGYDLVDLNGPIQVEKEETLSSNLDLMSYVELKVQSPTFSLSPLANQEPSECTILARKSFQRNHNPHFENYLRSVSSCMRSSPQLVPLSYVAKSESSSVASSRKPCGNLRHIPMAVQALPCFKSPTSLSGSAKLSAGNQGISPVKYHLNGNSADSPCVEGISSLQNNLSLKSHLESMTLNVTSLKANKEADCLTRMESGLSQAFPVFSSDFDLKRLGYNDCQNYENVFGDKPCIPSRYISTPSNFHPNRFEDKEISNKEKVGNLGIDSDPLLTNYGDDNKPSSFGSLVDLNSCITENEALIYSVPSAVTKRTIEIDLEAPVSPENKEVSPPRGESEEHQLEPSVQLPQQECRDPHGELVRVAAEAIVSISSTNVQLQVDNDCLLWFAGIVSARTGNLENDLEPLRHGIDDFEEQALRFKESKVEAYSCKGNDSIVNRKGAMSLPSHQRKGRTRRLRQRKDFQTECLPRIPSLSTNDAEGDPQIIGWMTEQGSSPAETGLKRSAGRYGFSRGRRRARASISPPILEGSTVCLPLKHQVNREELCLTESGLSGWGKINRRRRGRRVAATNPYLIFQMGAVMSN